MQRLLLLGLNHTTAPLGVRERLSFSRQQRLAALGQLRAMYPRCEFVLLSTCNRVEVYAAREVHGHPRMEEIAQFLADFHGVDLSLVTNHVYQKTQMAVAEHLFAVAASLDSMVVGEREILGQVREAYDAACECGAVGTMLNPLFQRAIRAGKAVASDALPADEAPSIARAAVNLAYGVAGSFAEKTILSIGAGDVARQVLRYLRPLRPSRLLVSNRDASRARVLAQDVGGEVIEFNSIANSLAAADAVFTSTASAEPILQRSHFELSRDAHRSTQLVIDLGVPRDVDASVRELAHVRLHDIDDLRPVPANTGGFSERAIDRARGLVRSHLEEYAAWQRARDFGPVIEALYDRYHEIAEQELARAFAGIQNSSPHDMERLREFSRRMVNKLLHDPVQALRGADSLQSPSPNYLGAMRQLFNLPTPPDDPS